jgi:outer membrane protein assembly factor BamB
MTGSYELPEQEPERAGQADRTAIDQFRASLEAAEADADGVEAVDWPQLFGPRRTCVAADQRVDLTWGPQGPPAIWSVEVGTGYGSPVVAADRVVFNHRVDDQERVECLRAADGTTLWTHRYPTSFECEYDYSSGPYSTPLIADGRVYSAGGQGQFYCLDLESGDVLWERNLHAEYGVEDGEFPVGASPLIDDGRLFFNLGAVDKQAGVIALDPLTGADLWHSTDHPAGYCSPFAATIHEQAFLFVMTNRGLVSLDPETGRMDWMVEHYSRSPMSYNAVSPLVVDDKVLIMTGPGPGAVCVQVAADRSFRELWRDRRVLDSQFNSLMRYGSDVIGFTAAGQGGAELRCIDIGSGDLRWRYHSLLRRGQGLVVGDALVLLGERGHLAALIPTDDEPGVLAFTEQPIMGDPCYAAPALAGSRLYLKDEQRLACFDLSVKNRSEKGSDGLRRGNQTNQIDSPSTGSDRFSDRHQELSPDG